MKKEEFYCPVTYLTPPKTFFLGAQRATHSRLLTSAPYPIRLTLLHSWIHFARCFVERFQCKPISKQSFLGAHMHPLHHFPAYTGDRVATQRQHRQSRRGKEHWDKKLKAERGKEYRGKEVVQSSGSLSLFTSL